MNYENHIEMNKYYGLDFGLRIVESDNSVYHDCKAGDIIYLKNYSYSKIIPICGHDFRAKLDLFSFDLLIAMEKSSFIHKTNVLNDNRPLEIILIAEGFKYLKWREEKLNQPVDELMEYLKKFYAIWPDRYGHIGRM